MDRSKTLQTSKNIRSLIYSLHSAFNYAMLPPVYNRSPSLESRGLEPRSGASTQLVHGTNAHHASILQTVANV